MAPTASPSRIVRSIPTDQTGVRYYRTEDGTLWQYDITHGGSDAYCVSGHLRGKIESDGCIHVRGTR